MRGADPKDGNLPLTETERKVVSTNFLEKLTATSVTCFYRKPTGGKSYRLSFWEGTRPTNVSGILPVELDIAVPSCPATWGEAVALGWGSGAWEKAATQARADAAERQAEADLESARARETPESRAKDWTAKARALPATRDADDLALARGIEAELSSLENSIGELHSRPFNDRLVKPGGLFERINRLGQIAFIKSRSLNPAPAGRRAFDAWDERLGGPAVSAVARLQKIVHYRQNRRVRLAEITGDAGEREMQSWGNIDFSPVWAGQSILLEVFARHLDGRPTLDPSFQRKIASDLQRARPSEDPGRPYYYHVPSEAKPAWMMTPEEEEAQGNKVAGGLVNAVLAVGDLIRLVDKVDADIRESRVAFWKCYATRCNEAGKAFYAYSHAMWTKDNFYFARPAVSDAMINRGMSFLGDGAIDGGPVSHCAPQANKLSEAMAGAVNRSQGNPVVSAQAVVAVMKGPAYASRQACRDRMEYIFRPRFL